MVLTYIEETREGIHRYRLDLRNIFPDSQARIQFERRWQEFCQGTPDYKGLFTRQDDYLFYSTESFVPRTEDTRTPVLLVLGNPALQSVHAGMCFAFERVERQEHRFWRALRAAGWISFEDTEIALLTDPTTRNAHRRNQLLSGTYHSPFLVGIEVFFTFPTPASMPRWSGVGGLVALFGRRAVRILADVERERLAVTIAGWVSRGGAVVTFQRDAYEGLRDPCSRPYSNVDARNGKLSSPSSAGYPVPLYGAPPTRLAHSQMFQDVLKRYEVMISRA